MLVGLRVAASKLPGDTFQVTPRAVADSKAIIDPLGNAILGPVANDAVHPLVNDLHTAGSVPSMAVLAGVLLRRCQRRQPGRSGVGEVGSRAPPS
jgi:hypothetical protein